VRKKLSVDFEFSDFTDYEVGVLAAHVEDYYGAVRLATI
jgi:hypothetical protein